MRLNLYRLNLPVSSNTFVLDFIQSEHAGIRAAFTTFWRTNYREVVFLGDRVCLAWFITKCLYFTNNRRAWSTRRSRSTATCHLHSFNQFHQQFWHPCMSVTLRAGCPARLGRVHPGMPVVCNGCGRCCARPRCRRPGSTAGG